MSASIPRRVRLLASVSLVLLSLVLIPVVLAAAGSLVALLTAPVGLAGAAAGAWWVITERMPRRALGILGVVIGTAVVAGAALAAADDGDGRAWEWALVAALAVGAAVCSRLALRATLHTIDLTRSFPEFRPRRAVLICSPWSGGGKVETFGLVAKAQALGVEVILLDRGLDLEELARDAVRADAHADSSRSGESRACSNQNLMSRTTTLEV